MGTDCSTSIHCKKLFVTVTYITGICAVGVKQLHGPYKQHFLEAFLFFFPKEEVEFTAIAKKLPEFVYREASALHSGEVSSFHRA